MTSRLHHNAIPIIKDRLYFLRVDGSVPKSNDREVFFSVDNRLTYMPFNEDFGPLSMACTFRFCVRLASVLERCRDQIIYFCTANTRKTLSNAAVLIGIWQVVYLKRTASEAFAPLKAYGPYLSFRDPSRMEDDFRLQPLHCIRGFLKGAEFNWVSFHPGPNVFNLRQYEHYEAVEHGDLSVLIPGKFLAFAGPKGIGYTEGYSSFTPTQLAPILRQFGVTTIIRLNSPCYDRSEFLKLGFDHRDLIYPDGSVPNAQVLQKFLKIAEEAEGTVGVHCKAGLGRTGTTVGCYMMKHYHMTAMEVIGWMRLARPGSVIGQQQYFLMKMQKKMWRQGKEYRAAKRRRLKMLQREGKQRAQTEAQTTATDGPPQVAEMDTRSDVKSAHQPHLPPALPLDMKKYADTKDRHGEGGGGGGGGGGVVPSGTSSTPPSLTSHSVPRLSSLDTRLSHQPTPPIAEVFGAVTPSPTASGDWSELRATPTSRTVFAAPFSGGKVLVGMAAAAQRGGSSGDLPTTQTRISTATGVAALSHDAHRIKRMRVGATPSPTTMGQSVRGGKRSPSSASTTTPRSSGRYTPSGSSPSVSSPSVDSSTPEAAMEPAGGGDGAGSAKVFRSLSHFHSSSLNSVQAAAGGVGGAASLVTPFPPTPSPTLPLVGAKTSPADADSSSSSPQSTPTVSTSSSKTTAGGGRGPVSTPSPTPSPPSGKAGARQRRRVPRGGAHQSPAAPAGRVGERSVAGRKKRTKATPGKRTVRRAGSLGQAGGGVTGGQRRTRGVRRAASTASKRSSAGGGGGAGKRSGGAKTRRSSSHTLPSPGASHMSPAGGSGAMSSSSAVTRTPPSALSALRASGGRRSSGRAGSAGGGGGSRRSASGVSPSHELMQRVSASLTGGDRLGGISSSSGSGARPGGRRSVGSMVLPVPSLVRGGVSEAATGRRAVAGSGASVRRGPAASPHDRFRYPESPLSKLAPSEVDPRHHHLHDTPGRDGEAGVRSPLGSSLTPASPGQHMVRSPQSSVLGSPFAGRSPGAFASPMPSQSSGVRYGTARAQSGLSSQYQARVQQAAASSSSHAVFSPVQSPDSALDDANFQFSPESYDAYGYRERRLAGGASASSSGRTKGLNGLRGPGHNTPPFREVSPRSRRPSPAKPRRSARSSAAGVGSASKRAVGESATGTSRSSARRSVGRMPLYYSSEATRRSSGRKSRSKPP